MTGFDELIGTEPAGAARERLREVHELLVHAGPPPEITPELAAGPTLGMTLSRARSFSRRRRSMILTAIAATLVAAVIGFGLSSPGHGNRYPVLSLRGTSLAPAASGTLDVLPPKGTKPRLKLEVKGLPSLKEAYVVYLVRNGRPIAPCGSFTVSNQNREVTKVLVSPYRLQSSDTWIVTTPSPDDGETPGSTVLQ
jgi:hypothetical protein